MTQSVPRPRLVASRVAVVLATLVAVVACVLLYARDAVFQADGFAGRAVTAARTDPVRERLAQEITTRGIEGAEADLIGLRPVIEAAVRQVISGAAFEAVLRTAAEEAHRTVFATDGDRLVLQLSDVLLLASFALERLPEASTDLAQRAEAASGALVEVSDRDGFADLAHLADRLRALGIVAPIVAALLFAAAIALAGERRRAVVATGWGVAASGAMVAAGVILYGALLRGGVSDPDDEALIGAIYDAYFGDLRTIGLLVGAAGIAIAATARQVLQPLEVSDLLRAAAARVAATPRAPALRIVRAVAAIGLGIGVIGAWEVAVRLVVMGGGALLVLVGVSEIARVTGGATPRQPTAHPRATRARALRVAGAGAAPVVVAITAVVLSGGASSAVASRADECNGARELCERRLDEVAIPATHNSMSAADEPGWLFASQTGGIAQQLSFGIRGLLIDVTYGSPSGGRVVTDLASVPAEVQETLEGFGPDAVAAADRVRASLGLGFDPSKRGVYLCHGFCELGATEVLPVLRDINAFLIQNPGEVVVIVVQDNGVAAADVVATIEQSGLRDLVADLDPAKPMPTLGDMIEDGTRLVVMAENDASGPSWYEDAFVLTQETPYSFSTVAAVDAPASCDLNRGAPESPLFLMNNWVERLSPSVRDAEAVNAFDTLLARAEECQRLRERLPNLLAVNFYASGDVLGVARQLSGLPRDPAP